MLSVSHLNCWFPDSDSPYHLKREKQILYDITLTVNQGQTVALVGESGSGKSLTALTILRLLEENTAIRSKGSIVFEQDNLLDLPLKQMRKIRGNRIAMIFQEPMTSLNPVYTIGNQLIEPLRLHQHLDAQQAWVEAVKLLERTGIEDPEKRLNVYPHQLSGGQRQRVMIAMALACKPALLIADEPTTALDVSIQAQILRLIKGIQKEYGMGMLLITHDLNVVRSIADFIYIMKDGKILEEGTADTIFMSPSHTYTQKLMASIPQVKTEIKINSDNLLTVNKLSCTFKLNDGWETPFKRKFIQVHAVDNVNLIIPRGTTCGIIGESGSGKTTLAFALLKLVKSSGSILFDGIDLQNLSPRQILKERSKFQIVFQDPYSSLSPRLSVGEIVEEGLKVHRTELNRHDRKDLVINTLAEVGLDSEVVSRFPHEFSGGQRQRIAIARVIILNPELLILDEPTSALDMTIQTQIIELLSRLQKKFNLTYLFISHDLRVIRAIADNIIVMQHGQIVESGSADNIFNMPQEKYTKELFSAALDGIN